MVDYALIGPKWGGTGLGTGGGVITWAVDGTVAANFITIFNQAFIEWSQYADIQFKQVSSTASAQIDLGFTSIDGLNNTLGIAHYTFAGPSFISSSVEFDTGEGWHSVGGQAVSNSGVDLFIVALHEIGHTLGIDHYNVVPAVMNATYNGSVSGFTASDIHAIQAIYGAPAVIYGTAADDYMYAGTSGRTFVGGDGNDSINGGAGIDAMYGGGGNDGLFGGDGADSMSGGDGNDYIVGGNGNNSMFGDAGNDSLNGGPQNDYLVGGAGDDGMFGSDGNDQFFSSSGIDWMVGGRGADTFVFAKGDGADTIADFNVLEDHINVAGSDIHSFVELVAHTSFNGVNTVIELGGGDQITIMNVRPETLTSDLFYV
ncbi:Hemolysin-type calcium-binding repeat-containing protein [Tardiphaga sp. OK246]|uniref:matrixin family metalloprotease n=1 Tax=Tardiphaga sp. OK246 TaxID=1855307 RepID=UPI000B6D4B80|nr:matrixin family metalloprotease [Tardiphaga sp. OK246]SNT63915.1 Hemolysin-type calcium-binding repeat-containing protein [Tardiphaga sp. OK246]